MSILKQVMGIDVSLDDCVCNFSVLTEGLTVKVISSKTFPNTEGGLKDVQKWVKKIAAGNKEIRIVIEASGVYYEHFALGLQQSGFYVSVVLPNKAKKYMESLGLKSKNDQIDAKGLSQMGCEQNLEQWTPLSPFFHILRTYTRLHEDIQQKRTDTSNQLHALQHSAMQLREAVKILESLIKVFDKELKKIKDKLQAHIDTDTEVKEQIDHVCTIKGVGILTAATVAAETNGFCLFKNIPQLVSFAGMDVVEDQSGKRIGQTKISKKGNSHIRRILYMPAFNMMTYQVGAMPALYERTMKRHGVKMKSYVAIQRKLLVLIYTLWKKKEDFKADFHVKKTSNLEEVETSSRGGLEEPGKAA